MFETFSVILLLLYILTFFAYITDIRAEKPAFTRLKRVSLFVTLFLHLVFLFYIFSSFNHIPVTNKSELFTVVAFAAAFIYFLLELLTDVHGTGFLILFFSALFQLLSVFFVGKSSALSANELNVYIGMHVTAAIFGYVGFTISAAYGAMYVMLASKLKKNRFDALFERLPSLEILLKLSLTAFYVSFVMLTVALVLGAIWLPKIFPESTFNDPKVIITGAVWIVYAIGLFLKLTNRLYGKRFIYYSVYAFIFLILSASITSLLTDSFHAF